MQDEPIRADRRRFLRVVAATGAAPLASRAPIGATVTTPVIAHAPRPLKAANTNSATPPAPAFAYLSLDPDEAGFVEAMVDIMCPADSLTPAGVDCGLAVFIDRQLAGGFGKGERLGTQGRRQQGEPPLTPEQFYKTGIAAADAACRRKHGKHFSALAADDADAFLHGVAAGTVTDARVSLANWFNALVYPLFALACYADPNYGGNVGKMFRKMVAYPGLPAGRAHVMQASLGG